MLWLRRRSRPCIRRPNAPPAHSPGSTANLIDRILGRHSRERPETYLLDFFRGVVRDVPAYRKFLEREGVDPERVTTLADFAALPPTTKANYQRAFSLGELCRGGKLENADFLAVSTGSTGEPSAWPRFVSDEVGTTERFEQVLHDGPRAHERPTLAVICFALGSWVGGMYTTFACRHLAAKGYPLTLVTPGSNKAEILRVLRELGPEFEQTVLFGYPPFLKDVIDAGRAAGLDWGRFSVSLVTAGEVFSEEWRTLLCERLGGRVPALHTASLYGTADGGVLANETPLSIEVRRALSRKPEAARELFGEARLPTLCQYDPTHRFFEPAGDELLFSGDGGAPLVRYKILDRGGVIPYDDSARVPAPSRRGAAREHPCARRRGATDAVRLRVRSVELRALLLRGERVPRERERRPRATRRGRARHRQVRDADREERGRGSATRNLRRALRGLAGDRRARRPRHAVDSGGDRAPEQRVF